MSGSDAGGVVGIQNLLPAGQAMRVSYGGGGGGDGAPVYKPPSSSPPTLPYQGASDSPSVAAGGGSGVGTATVFPHNLNISVAGGGGSSSGGDALKRKRGRPRKYAPDGSLAYSPTPRPLMAVVTPAAVTTPAAAVAVATTSGTFTPLSPPPPAQQLPGLPPVDDAAAAIAQPKKARGRPAGSSNKKQHRKESIGSAGVGFTPHVINVTTGEDVFAKIMSFSQNGPRAVCIISAYGSISNVTFRQAATSGGTVTYEGRFDILSLSGSFLLSELGGHPSRTGGMSITLAGPNGWILGGCVAGLLTAASPVQVIVASFIPDSQRELPKASNHLGSLKIPPKIKTISSAAEMTGSPSSRGTLSESSGGAASPLNQSSGAYNPHGMSSMPWK